MIDTKALEIARALTARAVKIAQQLEDGPQFDGEAPFARLAIDGNEAILTWPKTEPVGAFWVITPAPEYRFPARLLEGPHGPEGDGSL